MKNNAESRTPALSAIVLCYRAGDSILDLLTALENSLERLGVAHELVLVANTWRNGHDRTPEVVNAYARGRDNVVVVAKMKEGAMGWDMRTGLSAARGDYMIVLDGDAQNPPGDVARMYLEMRARGYEVMKGRRVIRGDGVYRRLISFVYNLIFRLLFRTWRLWDINGKPKGLTRSAIEQMKLQADDWFVDAEIVLEARRLGLAIGELPVVFYDNPERGSFVRPSAILEFLNNMFRRRFSRDR